MLHEYLWTEQSLRCTRRATWPSTRKLSSISEAGLAVAISQTPAPPTDQEGICTQDKVGRQDEELSLCSAANKAVETHWGFQFGPPGTAPLILSSKAWHGMA